MYLYVYYTVFLYSWASQVALLVKNPPANAGDVRDAGLIPGWEKSPGEEKGTILKILGT